MPSSSQKSCRAQFSNQTPRYHAPLVPYGDSRAGVPAECGVGGTGTHVLIEPQLVEEHGLGPALLVPYVRRLHVEPARPHAVVGLRPVPVEARGGHIENAVVPPDRWRPDAAAGLRGADVELRATSECMADERPVDQVCAVVDGDAGEVFEG